MLYPEINEARTVTDLSGIWKFQLDDGKSFGEDWAKHALPSPVSMAVPGSYNDQKPALCYRDHYGLAFYQTEFDVPKPLLGERLWLRFGSVTHEACVYLNGELLGTHKGGFLPFEFEVSGLLKPGKNRLSVSVDNRINYGTLPIGNEAGAAFFGSDLPDIESVRKTPLPPRNLPNFDFFNYAGIHRPVKLYTTPKSYISDVTLVPGIEGKDGVVKYTVTTVSANGKTDETAAVSLTVYDEAGNIAAKADGASGTFCISNAHLWEPGAAYLYRAEIRFGNDCYVQKFGIRTVEVKGTDFLINGKPFYFKGAAKHEDSPLHGKGLDNVLNVADLSLYHWMHANSFRTAHYPYAEEMLDLCDEEGIVVIDETTAVGLNFGWNDKEGWKKFRTKEHHADVIRDLIARDKNHPCVVMWSIANEPDTEKQPEASYAYFKPLYDLAHALDPENRPVTVVVCQNDYVRDLVAPAMDVVCLNRYYGWYLYGGDLETARRAFELEMEYWKNVGKPVMMTEYGADTVAGLHQAVPGMFSEEYQVDYYRAMNSVLDSCPFVVGEQLWNFADFATVQGTMRVDGNKKGIFTRDRRPKLSAHYCKERWGAIPDFGYKR